MWLPLAAQADDAQDTTSGSSRPLVTVLSLDSRSGTSPIDLCGIPFSSLDWSSPSQQRLSVIQLILTMAILGRSQAIILTDGSEQISGLGV